MKEVKVDSKVRILKRGNTLNPVGSIGRVSACNGHISYRVIVKGFTDDNLVNNCSRDCFELYKPTKQEKIEKLLKKISKLNKK